MPQMPSDDAIPSPHYPLGQMVVAPLTGQTIGLNESQFVIAQWTAPGAQAGPPQLIAPIHVHYSDDEAWYVLEGALVVQVGKEEVEARAGPLTLPYRSRIGCPTNTTRSRGTRLAYHSFSKGKMLRTRS